MLTILASKLNPLNLSETDPIETFWPQGQVYERFNHYFEGHQKTPDDRRIPYDPIRCGRRNSARNLCNVIW